MAQDFWWPLLAGTLSAIIAAAVIDLVKGRHATQAATTVVYGGDHYGDNIRGGDAHNEFHHHEHNEYHHHEQPTPVRRQPPAPDGSSSDDIGKIIAIGIAIFIGVCAAVLAFLVAWPAILGFTLAFDVLLAIAALRARTLTSDPRERRFLWVLLIGIWTCQAIVWFFTLRNRDDQRGLAGSLDVLSERFPRIDDGVTGRATVIWKRLDKVIDVIGIDSVWVTAVQLLAVLTAAAMVIGVATHLWELWGARHAPHTQPRIRAPRVWGSTIALGLIAVLLVTGPAERLLNLGDAGSSRDTSEPKGPNNDRKSMNSERDDQAQRDLSK